MADIGCQIQKSKLMRPDNEELVESLERCGLPSDMAKLSSRAVKAMMSVCILPEWHATAHKFHCLLNLSAGNVAGVVGDGEQTERLNAVWKQGEGRLKHMLPANAMLAIEEISLQVTVESALRRTGQFQKSVLDGCSRVLLATLRLYTEQAKQSDVLASLGSSMFIQPGTDGPLQDAAKAASVLAKALEKQLGDGIGDEESSGASWLPWRSQDEADQGARHGLLKHFHISRLHPVCFNVIQSAGMCTASRPSCAAERWPAIVQGLGSNTDDMLAVAQSIFDGKPSHHSQSPTDRSLTSGFKGMTQPQFEQLL